MILVTGGAGFIGSHIVDYLIRTGERVVVLDDLSGGFIQNVNKKAIFIKGSITNARLVEKVFRKYKPEYVFHIAAYAAENLSHFIKRFNYNNNLIGSVNLLNESVKNGVKCFVFTSSMAVYGNNPVPFNEDMTPMTEDSYGIAKLAVEQELKVTKKIFGLDYIIFRPHNVYGERQNIGDRYRNVIGIFMNQILQEKPVTIFGDGLQTRAFSYIRDIVPTISNSIYNPDAYNQIFNIGADTPYTVKDLSFMVARAMGVGYGFIHLPERKEVKEAWSSQDKIKDKLFYESRYSLEEGIKNMAEWVKKEGSKKSKQFKNIEITKNIPEIWLREY